MKNTQTKTEASESTSHAERSLAVDESRCLGKLLVFVLMALSCFMEDGDRS